MAEMKQSGGFVLGIALVAGLTAVPSVRATSISVIEGTERGDYPRILLDGGSLRQRADGGWAALLPVDAGALRLCPISSRPGLDSHMPWRWNRIDISRLGQ